jgi:hypothetical protein
MTIEKTNNSKEKPILFKIKGTTNKFSADGTLTITTC